MAHTKRALSESGFSLGKITGGTRWLCRIIKVGAGSTGFYTEEGLKTSGPPAFPVGTKVNADHQSMSDSYDKPAGSVTTLIGAIVSEPKFMDSGEDDPGLYGEIEFSKDWAPFVEQFSPILGLSIHASGYGDQMTETGLPIIEGIIPDLLNTVDLVTVPGAGGRLLQLMESYTGEMPPGLKLVMEKRDKMDSEVSPEEHDDGKDNGMKPEEIQALQEALVNAIKTSFTELKESLAPAPTVDPDADAAQAPELTEVVEAVVSAGLPKSARVKVLESVKGGAKVADAIATEQAYIKDLSEALVVEEGSTGHVKEVGTADFAISGWSK